MRRAPKAMAQFWALNIGVALVTFARHELVPMTLAYLVGAIVAVAVLVFRLPGDATMVELSRQVLLGLLLAGALWLFLLIFIVTPARLWSELKRENDELTEALEVRAALEANISALVESQGQVLKLASDMFSGHKTGTPEEFEIIVKPMLTAVHRAGVQYGARFTAVLLGMGSRDISQQEMLERIAVALSDTIADLSVERSDINQRPIPRRSTDRR